MVFCIDVDSLFSGGECRGRKPNVRVFLLALLCILASEMEAGSGPSGSLCDTSLFAFGPVTHSDCKSGSLNESGTRV